MLNLRKMKTHKKLPLLMLLLFLSEGGGIACWGADPTVNPSESERLATHYVRESIQENLPLIDLIPQDPAAVSQWTERQQAASQQLPRAQKHKKKFAGKKRSTTAAVAEEEDEGEKREKKKRKKDKEPEKRKK